MMKSKLSLIILVLWCACIAVAQEKTLFLVHTNDTHSCVEPISPNHADSSLADKGGFVRRTALVSQLRRAHPEDMLLFDCGDFSQGSLYYNIFRGEAEVKLMNLMGYDACAIGNHEFDCGLENLARFFTDGGFSVCLQQLRFLRHAMRRVGATLCDYGTQRPACGSGGCESET